jgi:SulP family sulfate permease
VGFAVAVAVGKVYASRHRYRIDGTQELVGLGLANIGGALFQGYPVTGSLSRTAVNDDAGAETTLAGIAMAALVAVTLLFLTPLFAYLPKAVLASIVMVAVLRLVDVEKIRFLWHAKRSDFALAVLTFAGTLVFGIEEGILGGILISVLLVIQRSFRPNITVIGRLPGSNTFADVERHPEALTRTDVVVFRMESSLYFANAQLLKDKILEVMARDEGLQYLVLDAYPVNRIDGTAAYALREVVETFREEGYQFVFAGVKGEAMDVLRRAGIIELVGEDYFFREVHRAVEAVTEVEEEPAVESSSRVQEAAVGDADAHDSSVPGAEKAR